MNKFLKRKHNRNHEENDALKREVKVNELKDALGPLSGRNLKYCTDACLRRYLEVRSWDVDKAKKMLEETIRWRNTYKPEEIRWHEVAQEGETGKAFRANFRDLQARPVLIMRAGMQNTKSTEGIVRHLVYILENAILNLPEGQEQIPCLIDFTRFSLNDVSVRTARDIINTVQSHYPGRIAIAFLYNPPTIFESVYKVIKYFLDRKTSQKIKFVYPENKGSVDLMISFFDVDNLPSEFGGKATLKYNHEEFSRLMEQDDAKTAKFWGFYDKSYQISNGCSMADAGTESVPLAPPDS